MSRIFISYKRVDKDEVFKIKDQIESALGEKCWIDLDGIESDAQFANVIIKAINECEVFLFMYSAAHSQITDYKNDWTVRELDFAQHKKKRIVFVNLDGSPLSDWFYMLFGTMQQVDATSSESLTKLIQDINVWLTSSSTVISEFPSIESAHTVSGLRFLEQKQFPLARDEFNKGIVEGDADSMFYLGKMYIERLYYHNHESEGIDLLKQAASFGNIKAIEYLFKHINLNQQDEARITRIIINELENKAEYGTDEDKYALAVLFQFGDGKIGKNIDKAIYWFEKCISYKDARHHLQWLRNNNTLK